MKRLLCYTALTACLAAPLTAQAANIDFGLNTFNNLDLGTSHTFTVGLLSIVATDEDNSAAIGGQGLHGDLFGKNGGTSADEYGLGYTQGTDHEITTGDGYIQIKISGLIGKVLGTTIDFGTNSVTQGEQWQVWGTNVDDISTTHFDGLHSDAHELDHGTTEVSNIGLADIGTYMYLDFIAVGHDSTFAPSNFLISDITATPLAAPEPTSIALLGFGLLGTLVAARRMRV